MIGFLFRGFAFLGVLAIVLGLIARYVPPDRVETSFLMAVHDKQGRLKSDRPPSIILVGGSNVAFGFDSRQLSRALDTPVLNQGLHAGFGIDLMLHQIEPHLLQGDVVVLMFEYELWQPERTGSQAIAATLVDIMPGWWKHFSSTERLRLTDDVLPYLGRKAYANIRDIANDWLGRQIEYSGLSIYNQNGFNQHGDLTSHWQRSTLDFPPVASPPNTSTDKRLMARVAAFHHRIVSKGVRCVLLPTVLENESAIRQSRLIKVISSDLDDAGIPLTVEPEVFYADRSKFFDTPHHLNREGVTWRTELVAHLLEPIVRSSSSAAPSNRSPNGSQSRPTENDDDGPE